MYDLYALIAYVNLIDILDVSRCVLSVLRNLSMTPPNDQIMAQHVKCVALFVEYLSSPKMELVKDALESLSCILQQPHQSLYYYNHR